VIDTPNILINTSRNQFKNTTKNYSLDYSIKILWQIMPNHV